MVKILRKNKQWFLAVFGVMLLVVFLFTGTSSMFQPDPSKQKVAMIGSAVVTAGEFDRAQREFEVVKNLAPMFVQAQLGIQQGPHWLLLVREAEKAGLVGEANDGQEWMAKELPETEAILSLMIENQRMDQRLLQQLLAMPAFTQGRIDQTTQAMMNLKPRLAGDGRMTLEDFDRAVAKLRGVVRLVNAYNRAARISDKQIIADAQRLGDSVFADVVVIPASRLAQDAPTPSEAEIVGHFETYREVRPGEGERGFGYIQPYRVKFEFLELSREAVGQAVLLDPIAVNKFYQQNRASFPGEYAAERVAVEKKLRDTRTDELLQQWDAVYKTRIKSSLRGAVADAGIRVLPSDWAEKRPTMEMLAREVTQTVSENTGVAMPLPSVRVLARDWTRLDQVTNVPQIGTAELPFGGRRVPLAQMLLALHEFNPASTLGFQSRVPFDQFLTTANGNRYYVCVLDHREPGPAESLDEVRAQVVRDLRLSWAFDQLGAQTAALRDLAVAEGLEAVAKRFSATPGEAPLQPVKNTRISRESAGDERVPQLDVEAVRTTLMDAAAKRGMLSPPTPESVGERTFAFELPRTLSVAVVQLTYPRPFTAEDLRTLNRNQYQIFLREEVQAAAPDASNPFSFENLSRQLGYRDLNEKAAPATPAATPAEATPPSK